MADESQKWLHDFLTGFNPGLAGLALAGLAGCGKLIYDFWKVVIDGFANKSKAQLDKEIQENTSRIDANDRLIKVLEENVLEARNNTSLALKHVAECEAKHQSVIELVLEMAMNGEKIETMAKKLKLEADVSKVVANAVSDKLTGNESAVLENLKDIKP